MHEEDPACREVVVGTFSAQGSVSHTLSVHDALSASAVFYGAARPKQITNTSFIK